MAAAAALTGLGAAGTVGGGPAFAAPLVPVGSAPVVPLGSRRLGTVPAASHEQLAFVLRPRNAAALDSYATLVSEPGSAIFHHFLAEKQFRARFGPSTAEIEGVTRALRHNGLHVGPVTQEGLILTVTGTAARIEAALHTRIELYRLPSGRLATANVTAPVIPAPLASSVEAVIGLDDLVLPQSSAEPAPRLPAGRSAGPPPGGRSPRVPVGPGPTACAAAADEAAAADAHTPAQLATAYSMNGLYNKGDFGKGVTVALFELEPFSPTDIAAYQRCFGTHASVTTVPVDHGAGAGAGSGESALDIEDVIGIAPQARIRVYEAPNTWADLLTELDRIATDDTAQVVSSSWGACEAQLPSGVAASENTVFEQMAVQGQTFFGITGDEGSVGCIPNGFGTNDVAFGYGSPTGLALDPSTQTLYTTLESEGQVEVVNAVTGVFVGDVTVGTGPTAIAVDSTSHEAFVANQDAGTVSEFSTATCNAAVVSGCTATPTTIPVGTDPTALAIDPLTATVYVANSGGAGTVSVISETSMSVVGTVTLGGSPGGVAIDAAASDNRIFVTNSATDNVSVILGASCDAAVPTCTATPAAQAAGADPLGIAFDPATGDVYVADDDESGTLSVLAGATLKGVAIVSVGQYPVAVALSPSGEQILAAGKASGYDAGAGAISVVSAATNRLTTYLAAGSSPSSVVSDPSINTIWAVDPTAGEQTLINIPLYPNVWDPGTQPFATSVGGTELTAVSPKPVEAAWNETLNRLTGVPEGAGGGGISQVFKMPSWQKGRGVVNAYSSRKPCGAATGYCREAPDVSAAADWMHGYIIFYDGYWQGYGGTSAAAPFWAGLTALIDARPGTHRLGLLAPILYALVNAGHHDFNDVTTGNIDYSTADNGDYPATPHYDLATGLGSPIASGLAADLLPAFLPIISPAALAHAKLAKPYAVQLRQTGAGGRIVWKLVGKLPRGITFSGAGLLSGTPESSGVFHLTVSVHVSGVAATTATLAYVLVVAK
jgi:YVTN family beta-propeller protein